MNDIRNNLYSLESRIAFAEKQKIEKVKVEKSIDGKRHERISGNTYILTVFPEEYEKAKYMAEKYNLFHENAVSSTVEKSKNPGDFFKECSRSNESYDCLCKSFESKGKGARRKTNSKKRNVKNKIHRTAKKKYTVKEILKRVGSGLLAATLAIAGGCYTKKTVDEYKKETAATVLETVKNKLNADKIWDNSTLYSSNSGNMEIIIEGKNGMDFRYCASIIDGDKIVKVDEVQNSDVVNAVSTAAAAQNGNLFSALKAQQLVDDINKGELNLSFPGNEGKSNDVKDIAGDER